jgi:hypothetical protein
MNVVIYDLKIKQLNEVLEKWGNVYHALPDTKNDSISFEIIDDIMPWIYEAQRLITEILEMRQRDDI